jgi:hypothetical protein
LQPLSNVVSETAEAEALEARYFNEVDLSDIVHFKRVICRPPPRINVTQAGSKDSDSSTQTVYMPTRIIKPPSIALTKSSNGSTNKAEVEIFKSFRVSMEDPVYKVQPVALKKFNVNSNWEKYALYIVYGNVERCLGLEEKPLVISNNWIERARDPCLC